MTSWFVPRAIWLFGIGLVLGGLLPVLLFMGHSFLPAAKVAPVLNLLPEFLSAWLMNPAAWLPVHKAMRMLNGLHFGLLVFAALGVAVMGLGAITVRRQMAIFDAAERRKEDRLRRVQQYRDSGRLEPFIGPDRDADRVSSAQHQGHDAPRRRVA